MKFPFKKEEQKPLNTPVIEMRKNSGGYLWWILGGVIVLVLIFLGITR